ncbi:hypothetical protein LCGC14_0731860 [marine sediment metagenome]|uniref:Dolichol kinase n=1 Tax=marine sediment metagenome TaxID=412755 RepID=A0A0F9QUB6_9ZZZZ|nr:MAG: Cytidylyltransferase family protein [Candidatus Lokiarchaeum sp. GC14_75]
MYYLPTSIIFIGYFILTLIYIYRNRKIKIEKHLLLNEIIIAFLFLLAGVLFPFLYQYNSPNLSQKSLDNLWLITSTIIMLDMSFWMIILLYNRRLSKHNPEIMAERDYKKYCEELNENWVDDLRSELGRKVLHLFAGLIIFFFWTIGLILDDLGILGQIGLDNYSFTFWIITTIGFGLVVMFHIGDLTRLNKFYMLPKWSKTAYKSMRPDEYGTFTAATPLVLSFIPFILAPFPIFGSVVLITVGADTAACIIGKKFGKHPLKKNSNKTVEGFIAGGVSTFIIVLLIATLYHPWMSISIQQIIIMGIVATLLFLLIDAFTKNISDNILNPLLTGFGMWIIFLL